MAAPDDGWTIVYKGKPISLVAPDAATPSAPLAAEAGGSGSDKAAKTKLEPTPPQKTEVEKALAVYEAARQALGPDDRATQEYAAALVLARQKRDAARGA